MMKLGEVVYHPVKVKIDGRKFFLLWYALQNEDRVFSINDELIVFSFLEELIDFSKNKELSINLEDEVSLYDLDRPFEDSSAEELLNFWNIFTDIAFSTNISFRGDMHGKLRNRAYDKLCNEVIWKEENSCFSEDEFELINELWREGKEMIRQEIKE